MIDAERFKARFTPEYVKAAAMVGLPSDAILRTIRRDETFGGNNLRVPHRGEYELIERARDYERVQFRADEDLETLAGRCDAALAQLGRRINSALSGQATLAKPFNPLAAPFRSEIRPVASWEADEVVLYSAGPAPLMLEADGIFMLRVRPDDAEEILSGEQAAAQPNVLANLRTRYGDRLFCGNTDAWMIDPGPMTYEIRFGFYGNTGARRETELDIIERLSRKADEAIRKAKKS